MTYAQEKTVMLKNRLYGMNKVANHEEVLETITEAIEEAMKAQKEADFDAFQETFESYSEVTIGNAITRAEVKP